MAFLIVGLIGLFLICCLFYGIYSGVGAIVRGTKRSPAALPLSFEFEASAEALQVSTHISMVGELKALFELHQNGALTRDEFERVKKHIFSDISHPLEN